MGGGGSTEPITGRTPTKFVHSVLNSGSMLAAAIFFLLCLCLFLFMEFLLFLYTFLGATLEIVETNFGIKLSSSRGECLQILSSSVGIASGRVEAVSQMW